MADFFTSIRRDFDDAARRSGEIHDMMRAMYARFSAEQGIEPFVPPPFSMLKYQKEVDRLERAYNEHFNTLWNMLSKAKFSLTQRFFETIASRVKHVYDVANRDVESWLRAVMSPLETQVREHHLQLQRRLESVKRIHSASGELEERIGELEHQDEALTAQVGSADAKRRGDRRHRAAAGRASRRRQRLSRGSGALRLRGYAGLPAAISASYLAWSASFVSTKSGFTGMQSTGQTSTHCGVSK